MTVNTVDIDTRDPAAIVAAIERLQALLPPIAQGPRQVWAVKMNGRTVQLQDLFVGDLDAVAQRCSVRVEFFIDDPLHHANVALELAQLVAHEVGLEALPSPVSWRSIKQWFVEVDDDVPDDTLPDEDDEPDPTTGSAASTAG